jgi:acetylornithine deacetylase/succinyl-diaminopimelate desuccinylase-like protein
MLVSLRDLVTGRVKVEGFYSAVAEASSAEQARIAVLPFDEQAYRHEAGDVPETFSGEGSTLGECRTVRPIPDIKGMWGGYIGPGLKTISPSCATAKLTCRIVPEQLPDDIAEKVTAALKAAAPPAVRVHLRRGTGSRLVVIPAVHPGVHVGAVAMRDVFGVEPGISRCRGSIAPGGDVGTASWHACNLTWIRTTR